MERDEPELDERINFSERLNEIENSLPVPDNMARHGSYKSL
jgi:hypothetical protein